MKKKNRNILSVNYLKKKMNGAIAQLAAAAWTGPHLLDPQDHFEMTYDQFTRSARADSENTRDVADDIEDDVAHDRVRGYLPDYDMAAERLKKL
jgi:hypothetical protein